MGVAHRFAPAFVSAAAAFSTFTANAVDLANVRQGARTLIQQEVASKVPGASVAVAVNGVLVWQGNFGVADVAAARPVTEHTRFRIGSISKPLTAAGLMRLVERGGIDLDAPLQTYVPEFPIKDRPITLRLLGGHLSGLRNYRGDEALAAGPFLDTASRLNVFAHDALVAPPGEKFAYSGYNWDLIEAALERAAQQDFPVFMEHNVLEPLRLLDTRVERPGVSDSQCTQFYEVDAAGAFVIGPPMDPRHGWARGGFLSTSTDLVRFASALLRPGFLTSASLATLFTSQKTAGGEPTGYGIGWFVYSRPKVLYHSGWTVGGLSVLLLLPDTNTVVAILTNRGQLNLAEGHPLRFNLEEVAFKLARMFPPQGN